MSNLAGISVIIPNYNGKDLLPQILPTVITALKKTGLNYEIIVADDCSVDDSVQLLKEKFPQVKIIQNEINSGFSVTANKGIRASEYDWVLLMNSDVKLEENYFEPLLKYTERSDVFGVMGRIIGWDDDIIQDGARFPFFHGVKIKTSGNYLLKEIAEMNHGLYTMYLSGANAFINKKLFLQIDGFNEIFSPFYVEDFELSLRAWRMGYTCYYEYNSVCRHKTSVTINSEIKKRGIRKIYNRNKMYLHAIHLSNTKRAIWFFQLFLESVVHLFTFRWSYIQALAQFIKNYKKATACRNQLLQAAGNRKLLSVNEVVDKILLPIKGKALTRF